MTILNKLGTRQLRLNKNRTLIALVGIILSVSMITAVISLLFSFYRYLFDVEVEENGSWHLLLEDVPDEALQEIKNDPMFTEVTEIDPQGYSLYEGSKNNLKPYLYLISADEKAREMQHFKLLEGHLPSAEGEIALPENYYTDDNQPWKIGEKRRLTVSRREAGGFALGQNNPYVPPEEEHAAEEHDKALEEESDAEPEVLIPLAEKEYTLTGIYETPQFFTLESYDSPGYSALVYPDEALTETHMVFLSLRQPRQFKEALSKYSDFAAQENSSVLMFSAAYPLGGMKTFLLSSAVVLLLIICSAATALIYNAFAISVTERSKQFGLLSSAGASARQIRHMVLHESFVLAALGIPLGTAAGLGGIGLTLYLIRRYIGRIAEHESELRLRIVPGAILGAAVLSLIVILISAYIPAGRAARVTPIEAIRGQKDYQFKNVKTASFHQKLFGVEGLLAAKYFKRSRRRYMPAVAALSMSIVIFVSAAYFTSELLNKAEMYMRNRSSDLLYQPREEEKLPQDAEAFSAELEALPAVDRASFAYICNLPLLFDAEDLTDEALLYMGAFRTKEDKALAECEILFLPEASYKAYAEEIKLGDLPSPDAAVPEAIIKNTTHVRVGEGDAEHFEEISFLKKTGGEAELLIPRERSGMQFSGIYADDEGEMRIKYFDLKTSEVPETEEDPPAEPFIAEQKPCRLLFTASEAPAEARSSLRNALVFPLSALEKMLPDGKQSPYVRSEFYLYAEDNTEAYQEVLSFLRAEGLGSSGVYDFKSENMAIRTQVLTIRIMAAGFVSLISLIALVNVFNTITTNLNLRKKDFAMLRSVGMARSGLLRMLVYECLQYGLRAAAGGLIFSLMFTGLIHYAIGKAYRDAFRFPWSLFGAAAGITFVLVLITMLYGSRKLRRTKIVDELRTELT